MRADAQRVQVVILSRNGPVSGMRVFRSCAALPAADRARRLRPRPEAVALQRPLAANLFLSTNEADVRSALDAGVPVARVYPHSARASDSHHNEVRIAFDGDAVLFSDEAERVYCSQGLSPCRSHEQAYSATPLAPDPFKPLLETLHRLQREGGGAMRIRTALVTARSVPAHERAIRTLVDWRIDVDEARFLGDLPKGEFLREFEPEFFSDDQTRHADSAAGHVPAGRAACTSCALHCNHPAGRSPKGTFLHLTTFGWLPPGRRRLQHRHVSCTEAAGGQRLLMAGTSQPSMCSSAVVRRDVDFASNQKTGVRPVRSPG